MPTVTYISGTQRKDNPPRPPTPRRAALEMAKTCLLLDPDTPLRIVKY